MKSLEKYKVFLETPEYLAYEKWGHIWIKNKEHNRATRLCELAPKRKANTGKMCSSPDYEFMRKTLCKLKVPKDTKSDIGYYVAERISKINSKVHTR